jgi:hypothetical protein
MEDLDSRDASAPASRSSSVRPRPHFQLTVTPPSPPIDISPSSRPKSPPTKAEPQCSAELSASNMMLSAPITMHEAPRVSAQEQSATQNENESYQGDALMTESPSEERESLDEASEKTQKL